MSASVQIDPPGARFAALLTTVVLAVVLIGLLIRFTNLRNTGQGATA